jgi:hypothetical protein
LLAFNHTPQDFLGDEQLQQALKLNPPLFGIQTANTCRSFNGSSTVNQH